MFRLLATRCPTTQGRRNQPHRQADSATSLQYSGWHTQDALRTDFQTIRVPIH